MQQSTKVGLGLLVFCLSLMYVNNKANNYSEEKQREEIARKKEIKENTPRNPSGKRNLYNSREIILTDTPQLYLMHENGKLQFTPTGIPFWIQVSKNSKKVLSTNFTDWNHPSNEIWVSKRREDNEHAVWFSYYFAY